jgi:hypothetical protein
VAGAFFDFFFAWLFDDFLDFLVVLVAAVPVSGAIAVVPLGLAWAKDSSGTPEAARKVSKANPEINALMIELLGSK